MDDDKLDALAEALRSFEEKWARGPQFVEEDGPAVDEDLMRRFVGRALDPYAAIGVGENVLKYRAWFTAWKRMLDETRRKLRPDSGVDS